MSTKELVTFSQRLLREQHARAPYSLRHSLRLCAFLLTVGEVLVVFVLFRRMDFLGCYATAAYLAKEHVIGRITGRE